jgi:hypothetical protein
MSEVEHSGNAVERVESLDGLRRVLMPAAGIVVFLVGLLMLIQAVREGAFS